MEHVVAITGASGAVYGVRLVEILIERGHEVSLIISEPGKLVLAHELDYHFDDEQVVSVFAEKLGIPEAENLLRYYSNDDFMAPVCSGSHRTAGMVIIPCSMATLGAVANGLSSNLIERTADVMLKESRRLILVPRETPFSRIHLKNLLAAEEAGAKIVPPMPAFYHKPATVSDMVDFVVGKVLDQLEVEHELFKRWE
ncbi:MAG: aromatic acid decarboxylase [Candidatus Aquicultor primus]|uniref:Flavin prenyltransferase UbiX n=1 Tax=Candidatus Aquicultor primus TaxID=1797195 RepID=A0A1F2UI07_9ACTN|nr:MAG: aromatic acid decarboxylase [Candidatus Aquicultor primus]HCG99957.1 aromatic acid decarboxylase [Actinomycetota bacterium]